MSTEKIMSMLRGPKGTTVKVKILRRGVKDLLDFTIKRDKIPVFSLDAAYLIDKRIGYIKINRFAATTHKEFMEANKEIDFELSEEEMSFLKSISFTRRRLG
jgi:carboxyl-terminal processing protease